MRSPGSAAEKICLIVKKTKRNAGGESLVGWSPDLANHWEPLRIDWEPIGVAWAIPVDPWEPLDLGKWELDLLSDWEPVNFDWGDLDLGKWEPEPSAWAIPSGG
jgi:hypothetical protein